jgi:hypothetical protein
LVVLADLKGLIYDYRLGYVRANCAFPGFNVLGENDAPGGRIVTLGGYTTPEQVNSHLSWADRLYEQLEKKVQIFNGCTDGYTSAQEMTMLIRDAILLRPRLVICLSGFYNFAYKAGFVKEKKYAGILKMYPFTNLGQIAFYDKITSHFGLGNDKVYYGEENHAPAWKSWIEHEDIIHCLCEEFGIQHITLLQPCAFSGKYHRSQQEDIMLTEAFGITGTELAAYAVGFQEHYGRIAEAARARSYIIDISSLFDGDLEVYLDAFHVHERYINKIAGVVCKHVRIEARDNEK